MILEAFALLRAGPTHEEPERAMHHSDGNHHIHRDPERGDSGEEPQNQSQPAKGLGGDREPPLQWIAIAEVGRDSLEQAIDEDAEAPLMFELLA